MSEKETPLSPKQTMGIFHIGITMSLRCPEDTWPSRCALLTSYSQLWHREIIDFPTSQRNFATFMASEFRAPC